MAFKMRSPLHNKSPYKLDLQSAFESDDDKADKKEKEVEDETGEMVEDEGESNAEKYQQMPKDIQWHMIGHVQRNKVKYMAPFVDLIHGVDSLKLLQEINKQAAKHQRVIRCLLQIKIAEEDSKFGIYI